MNPPFSSTGGRVAQHKAMYGSRHVASALRRLQEGGRLVAIVGEAMSFHHPNFSEWCSALLASAMSAQTSR